MISIIVPTLNEEKVLEKTLLALRVLKAVKYELIVSDGGSNDKTLEIARKYADIVVENTPGHRQTIAEGRNTGAKAAHGDYLVFIDADVQIPNIDSFFIKILDDYQKNKKLVAISVYFKVFKEQATLGDKLFFNTINLVYNIMNNVLRIGAAGGEFQMVIRDAFIKIGGYNEKLAAGEDNDLFARLDKVGRTWVDSGLYVLHTSRRAHATGWLPLLATWFGNAFFTRFLGRSMSKEWTVIR